MHPLIIGAGLGALYLALGGKKPSLGGAPAFVPPPVVIEAPPPNPPSLTDLGRAKEMAIAIESDLRANGMNYDHARLRAFQRIAFAGKSKEIDGYYGPHTAGALAFFLEHDPPRPLYHDVRGSYAITPYAPAK